MASSRHAPQQGVPSSIQHVASAPVGLQATEELRGQAAGEPEAIIRKTAIEPEFVDRFDQRYGGLQITPMSNHQGLVSYRFETPSLAMGRLTALVSQSSSIGCDGFQSQPRS